MRLRRLFSVIVMLGLTACHYSINDPGTDPSPDQLYFPTGIAMDPDGRHLYVTNGNADLRFGGGTLQIIDSVRFDCARARHLGTVPADCSTFPESDADACSPDPLDPTSLLCEEAPFILANQTVKLGNFAGNMRIRKIDNARRQLFVAVRGDPSITKVEVDLTSVRGADPELAPPGVFRCVDDPATLTTHSGFDQASGKLLSPLGCDSSYLIQTFNCDGRLGCPALTSNLPPEPFSLRIEGPRLVATHLGTGEVSITDIDVHPPVPMHISQPFFAEDANRRHGAFAFAPQQPGVPDSLWYLTSNLSPTVATFRITEQGFVIPAISFTVAGAFAVGNDLRDINFEPGGARAFMTENNPPSLVVLDARALPDAILPGQNANRVVDIVNVCQDPSHMAVLRTVRNGIVKTTIYTVCFVSGQIMTVDPDAAQVEDTIIVGGGPNDIAFNFAQPLLDQQEPARRRAFVTTFSSSRVAMLDLDPDSPTFNRVVAQLGGRQ